MITFFRTDRNNFLNLLLLRFYVKTMTLVDVFSGYISSNCISHYSSFYIKQKALFKTNVTSFNHVCMECLCICYREKTAFLKNKSPVVSKLFY